MSLKYNLTNLEELITIIDLNHLIIQMLEQIGTTESLLRDNLIYQSFGKLILKEYLSIEQMELILTICRRNLFVGLESTEDDSVFVRSFSALVIVLILKKDKEKKYLTRNTIEQLLNECCTYLSKEVDIRGFVEDKGWAHSIAHGADLLTEVVKHRYFDLKYIEQCLEVVQACIFKNSISNIPYIDEEEERLIFIIEALSEKGMEIGKIDSLIESINKQLENNYQIEGSSVSFYRKKTNMLNFLRAYYFRVLDKEDSHSIQLKIISILNSWYNKFY